VADQGRAGDLGRVERGDDPVAMSSMLASGAPPLLPCPAIDREHGVTVVREITRLQRPDAVILFAAMNERDSRSFASKTFPPV